MRWRRISLILSAAYVSAFILAYCVPTFIHRREFDQAFSAWYKNPAPENASAFRAEQHKNEIIHLEDSAMGALLLLTVSFGIYEGLRIGKHYLSGKGRTQTSR
jgi:hypothetical protein